MRVFLWHGHGSWTTAFVQGSHEYFVPGRPGRGTDGMGRARTWDWPSNVHEVRPEEAAELDVDVLMIQRPHEVRLAKEWLRRRPGRDVPVVWVEHNAPQGRIADMRHPATEGDVDDL